MSEILSVTDLLIRRDGRDVLEIDTLDVREGEVLALIGPNGAGKSTLLLTLALLLHPVRGQVRFRGAAVLPGQELVTRRRMSLVLQDPLLQHTSVAKNVAAGLRFRGMPAAEINRRVQLWSRRLGIEALLERPAAGLSGGEAQRTSLARAMAIQPDVLLLDEPFSALDAPTRTRLLADLHGLLAETQISTVFVTHDLDEALLLGDRVAVLVGGRLRQVGPPELVFTAPQDAEVARFVGVETVIAAQVVRADDGLMTVEAAGQRLEVVGELPPGRAVYVCLRPEDVTLSRVDGQRAGSARNSLHGRISGLSPQGPLVRVVLDCGAPLQIVALITRTSAREMGLSEGQELAATFKASAVHVIER